jgi:hypothetical protein
VAEVFFNHAAELATVSNLFAVDGVATDPTTAQLIVTPPAGVAVTYTYSLAEITRTGTGAYTKDISCTSTVPGVWNAVWIGTGAASDVVTLTWSTVSTDLSGLYCTPELLKDRTGISDALDDVAILAACKAVKRWIDRHCDRHFNRLTATKTLTPPGWYCLPVPDLVSVTTLKTDAGGDGTYETTWAAGDYQLLPANAAVEVEPEPYTEIRAVGSNTFPTTYASPTSRSDLVQIVGVWGWPAVPDAITEAAKILSGDYLKLGGMAFGVAGYGDYGAVRARMSSPALEMLAPYRRHPVLIA